MFHTTSCSSLLLSSYMIREFYVIYQEELYTVYGHTHAKRPVRESSVIGCIDY